MIKNLDNRQRDKEFKTRNQDNKEELITDFEALQIRIASPEEILNWSYGEVTRAETINYRTQKPEKEGLFSEQIFGPVKDYECACSKYKGARYKGVICDRCGVEVTHSFVRRERMGHITLATPVAHIWFLRSIPSRIALVLDLPQNALEAVFYYNAYIVTKIDEEAKKKALNDIEKEYHNKLQHWPEDQLDELKKSYERAKEEVLVIKLQAIFSEVDYILLSKKYGQIFTAETGSQPIKTLLEKLNLKQVVDDLEKQVEKVKKPDRKLINRLKLCRSFLKNNIKPEWMVLTVLPVLPPDLRPMVQLEGGKFASYDLNDLYRRVINRNNRLIKLLELKAPEVIIKNEKRMLQEAVDALLDNSIRKTSRSTPMRAAQHRPLRSLADILQGKEGRFRQNLLGKRVDYSGRSVIVIGPNLNIDECGIPKKMALELFKPFVVGELIKRELAFSPRAANRFLEEGADVVWEILEQVIQDKLVLLNRAPSLHRLSVQALKPKLIEGLAIQVPALICYSFNADFDGDQMAVHLPLTDEAQIESKTRMLSSLGLLKPANGDPTVFPFQDVILGLHYLTREEETPEPLKIFANLEEAQLAYDNKLIHWQTKIKVRIPKENNELKETTLGKLLFNEALPKTMPFINEVMNAKLLKKIIRDVIYSNKDFKESAKVADRLKNLGFMCATQSGISWSLGDMKIPPQKPFLIKEAADKVAAINQQYEEGLLTEAEKKVLTQVQWREATEKVSQCVPEALNPQNPIFIIFDSGARGSWSVASQILGMKGQVVNPAGQLIDMPIVSSHYEGFTVLEYFAASHAGRKGLADTALKTAFAGYLTRRLADVSHDVIIREEDCHPKEGLVINRSEIEAIGENFEDKIFGRYLFEDVVDKNNKIIAKRDVLIDNDLVGKIAKSKVERVVVRSPLKCRSRLGVCRKCYGLDLGWNKPIDVGEAVGIIAAQSIGEPGTQLTLRTFHGGGVARVVDITQGLPRVEELFEARVPKGEAPISEVNGEVVSIKTEKHQHIISLKSSDNSKISKKGRSKVGANSIINYMVPEVATLWVKEGDKVKKGDQLCEGSLNLKTLLEVMGEEVCQKYILREVKKIYLAGGENINDKHFEIILRQMFSRVLITESGDSDFIAGEIVSKNSFLNTVDQLQREKKKPPKAQQIIKGIKAVALSADGFLSAASFQETSRVLINASIEARIDYLRGLKDNVIIGRLIPAGTGFRK